MNEVVGLPRWADPGLVCDRDALLADMGPERAGRAELLRAPGGDYDYLKQPPDVERP